VSGLAGIGCLVPLSKAESRLTRAAGGPSKDDLLWDRMMTKLKYRNEWLREYAIISREFSREERLPRS
jgi:hypothetical protein